MNFTNLGESTSNATYDNVLNLSKGDVLDLTKAAPSLKNIIVGAGWDVNDFGKDSYDLDISAFLLDKDRRVTTAKVSERVVFFNMLHQQGIALEGDNLTGAGDGDDERIDVSLDDIAPDINEIIFNVNIYDAKKKNQTFGMVRNSYIRLLDADNNEKELARFDLKDDASTATAVTFARLFRTSNGWSFEAIGDTYNVADLNELLSRYL